MRRHVIHAWQRAVTGDVINILVMRAFIGGFEERQRYVVRQTQRQVHHRKRDDDRASQRHRAALDFQHDDSRFYAYSHEVESNPRTTSQTVALITCRGVSRIHPG